MDEKYNSETVTILLKDTTKKVESVERRVDNLSKKVDLKITSFEDRVDSKFNSLIGKFDAHADKVDELIDRLSSRTSNNEVLFHDNDKKIQYLELVIKNKFNDISELENKFNDHSKTLNVLNNNFNVKNTTEELLKKTNQEKNSKIKIYAAVISTVIGLISFIIPFL